MPISYDKLWKLLIDKKMNRTDLKDASGISFNVLAKMGKNEFVSMESLKCRIRSRWYSVPLTWEADAFLIRQAHLYPRMILNRKHALVTDTLHKVRFLDGINGDKVAAAFLNTYTFALSETLGRSYGGGVLTFEPGEMRKIRIPMKMSEHLDLQKIDQLQRDGKIEEILQYTDKFLLHDGLGLSEYEIVLLRSIWNKLRNRRMTRKNRKIRH